jgi:LmbE family N-acetylglucosaminyl deacetylase
MKLRLFIVLLIAFLAAAYASEVAEDRGAMGLAQALKRLDVVESVLHTGAHPDDENSSLLAWLARGQGVRTAYLAANRGDGGQNLLGTELFETLGVIRTEELLAARNLDHAQQFFTPTFDFGFSKTATETMAKWGHDQTLADFVRVIRQFRPEIIVSRFTGTPSDGHGHHQTAGILTKEAFKAAADPAFYPEYGKPWQAKKLYLNGMGGGPRGGQRNGADAAGPAPASPGITVNVGEYDPVLGRSYNEIAIEGRSLHRSQAQGGAREKGPRTTNLSLIDKTVNVADTADLYAGTLNKLPDLARLDPGIGSDLNTLEQKINAIREKVRLQRPAEIVPDLADAIKLLKQIRTRATNEHVQFLLNLKEPDFHEAARLAAGLVVDVMVPDDTVVPGQEFNLSVDVINGGPYDFTNVKTSPDLPPGWDAEVAGSTGSLKPGEKFTQRFKVKVGANAVYSQPYWLQQPRSGDRFDWPKGSAVNMPFDPALLDTHVEVQYQGVPIEMHHVAEFRSVDPLYGEQRSLLNVVPALSLRVSPEIAVVPLAGNRKKEFTVSVENQNPTPAESEVRLVLPQGWTSVPASRPVKFAKQGEKTTLTFTVTVPAVGGDFKVQAVAKLGTQEYKMGYQAISYPHIETHYIYAPSESKVEVFDVKTLATTVGYVEGAGDVVADALKQLGINVTMLSAQDLATADLSRFQTIVLGVRAYAVRDDLRAYNDRLMEFVKNGGTLITQYNRSNEFPAMQIGPYPFTLTGNNTYRVTDENAPVKILDPENSIFNVPNKITDKDFDGWVQERGTYFLSQWDPQYKPLLESKDPGEPPLQGGLVVGKYGKGTYVYTGYVFFRELPAGVKGAFRLFSNLVSIEN